MHTVSRFLARLRSPAWAWLLLLLAAAASAQPAKTMRVHFIDVGQGAATLLEFPCAAVLIDTGGEKTEFNSTSELTTYLDEFFEGRPDLNKTLSSLILTHPHIDHTRGVKEVLKRYKVLNGVTNGMETGSGRVGQMALHDKMEALQGDAADAPSRLRTVWKHQIPKGQGLVDEVISPVKCPGVDIAITALWGRVKTNPGWPAPLFANANNHSVVLRIDFGKASMLVAGDLQENAIADLIAYYKGTSKLDVDVVEVNHHGSHNGTTAQWLTATTPDYAVIEMGPEDRHASFTAWAYGHPRKVAMDLLAKGVKKTREPMEVTVATGAKAFVPVTLKRAIYGTGWDGSIVMEASHNGVWVPPEKAGGGNDKRVDLNTAAVDELVTLPMIGHAKAEAIVKFREAQRINRLDDLKQVPGIKSATIEAIRELVTPGN